MTPLQYWVGWFVAICCVAVIVGIAMIPTWILLLLIFLKGRV